MERTEVPVASPEGPAVKRQMFDEAIMTILRAAMSEVFLKHGDTVRSIGLFIDYNGNLNDAEIQKGLWLSAEGPVTSPAGVMGSTASCQRLLEAILFRGVQLQQNLQERLQILLTEIRQVHEEIEEQKAATPGGVGTRDSTTNRAGGAGTPTA